MRIVEIVTTYSAALSSNFRKPVYIELYKGAIIRSVTTHIEKRDNKWDVRIKAYLESSMEVKRFEGYLSASIAADGDQSIKSGMDLVISTRSDGTAEAELNMTISEVTKHTYISDLI